ncbi:outer membrane protein transport protein [Cohaesibacter sp. CAU 1516]|uniref:OmpP1/FadL family transporter n=1 Tax=Cohaesibacter sp. CAU 1516 TaxID=2576038 RepID=UPI0014856963|nr:outer membrane protein transport protein [Cohaesibacter sp. CAU 1516]
MSQQKYKKLLRSTVASVALVGAVASVSTTSAEAGGFALREQSAIGQGASFAGIAAGGGLSSMFWNPATLTQVGGMSTESVASFVIPRTDVNLTSGTPTTADPGDVGLDALVPASYMGAQLTEDLFVGLSVNAPYGMATKARNPSGSSFHAATSKIFTMDAKVNIAYRINDAFSVGVGIGAMYTDVRMTAARPGFFSSELKGDDWAPTFSAGVTIKPTDSTTIGIGYRHKTKLVLSGTEFLTLTTPNTNPITANLTLPSTVTVGLRQEISDRFAFLAGFEYTRWSELKDPISINGSVVGTSLLFGYKDGWYASVGGEYKHNENLTLRGGLGWEKSPIPDNHRNLRLPDADRLWASLGASYNVSDKFSVDVGYSHLFIKDDVKVSGSNAFGAYTGTADSAADIVSVAMRYKWKPDPLFANDDPIDRKY